jgi:4-amino-4-deoxy-L-arabinose transferase-like glycosyltransferase
LTPGSLRDQFRGDSLGVVGLAFIARGATLLWAGARFPPAADGVYYEKLAARIAEGWGSTWLWPDGKVTYAAHYPVGYPALVAGVYRIFGTSFVAAGWLNAVIGSVAALAVHRLALRAMPRRWAFAAGAAVALHPALVLYTPAVMTEGVAAALIAVAAWLTSRVRDGGLGRFSHRLGLIGVALGIATLVRPQSLVLAPCFGALAAAPDAAWRERAWRALVPTLLVLAVCAPWTVRNCLRMGRCALVSVNGGWNLAIGTDENAKGSWAAIDVPDACRTVWDEADKDVCFGREAQRKIAREPLRWLGLVPAKLAATFDSCGAPGFYLHTSNPFAFDDGQKARLGAVELLYERLCYLGGLLAAALVPGPRSRGRKLVAALGVPFLFQTHAYVAVLALVLALALLGRALASASSLVGVTFAALGVTALVHSVFFGAGRYGMVAFPLVTPLAAAGFFALASRRTAGALTAAGEDGHTGGRREETPRCL